MPNLRPAQVDFSALANLSDQFYQGQQDALNRSTQENRRKVLANFNGSNYGDLAKALFAGGDLQGGIELANLAAKPQGKFTADAYGRIFNTETGEFVNGQGASPTTQQAGATPGSPVNPNWFPAKNPDELKAGNYYKNGALADQELASVGDVPNQEAGSWSSLASNLEDVPYGIGAVAHSIESPNRQKFQTAGRHFINAINRRESGAQVNATEWRDAQERFLPKYGDSKEELANKARARKQALAGIAGEAGPMFNPATAIAPPEDNPTASPPPSNGGPIEAGAGGGSATLPAVKDRKRGQTYQTSKGPLVWTGIPGREWMAK